MESGDYTIHSSDVGGPSLNAKSFRKTKKGKKGQKGTKQDQEPSRPQLDSSHLSHRLLPTTITAQPPLSSENGGTISYSGKD